ncbi:carcinoembryonic antigen-related cell adhesion molecule 21-like [Talpa occidentalis]|uniref:carcinoembryonic antigen-related cell adhesion molecule 21-like n=1 Tax=Talpa occidentalis TaxID=50954 RepID=UPI00188E9DCF|nr:carcinoembryonic antigen-related cell adhesion molecule 21-like [Talpa occidentalis]
MEAPSAHGHRDRGPWQGLLLAASLSTFWILPATAQLTVEPEPANVAEGNDVLLRVSNLSREPLKYSWYKGRGVDSSQLIISYRVDTQNTTPGPMYSSRETIYPSGSLLIWKVTKADTGDYNVLVLYDDFSNGGGTGSFQVLEPVAPPSIQASNTIVTEHEDTVVLTCLTRDTGISILWLLNKQRLRLTDRMTLSQDRSSLTISPVRREDAGEYQCEVSNLASSSRSDPLTLTVKTEGDTTGLSEGVIAVILVGALSVVALAAALWCVSVCSSGRYEGISHIRSCPWPGGGYPAPVFWSLLIYP